MDYRIDEIEGIGPVNREKLIAAGIATTADLLKECGARSGRDKTAKATGLSASVILTFANMADLMRVNGIGRQFAELLVASGVDTIKELATRKAANLQPKLAETNAAKKLAKSVPAETQIQAWIDAAAQTEAMITH